MAKKTTKKEVSPSKIIIEGDFIDIVGTGKHNALKKGVTYNVTAEKAKLFIAKEWAKK